MKFLIFGDVVGRGGRDALSKALPDLKKEFNPDSVIINIENIAHGVGITPDTYAEAQKWQADVYTTGDHAWDKKPITPMLNAKDSKLIRPANYPSGVAGKGYCVYNVGAYRIAVINLQGQVFFKNHPNNPFLVLDELLQTNDIKEANIVLVDFHAEATSEKRALGFHADGRISAVWGTHTHVPTNDAQILPEGTGYVSDLGMNGSLHSIIGVKTAGPLNQFLTQIRSKREPATEAPFEINGLLLEIDPSTGKTTTIENVRRIVE